MKLKSNSETYRNAIKSENVEPSIDSCYFHREPYPDFTNIIEVNRLQDVISGTADRVRKILSPINKLNFSRTKRLTPSRATFYWDGN